MDVMTGLSSLEKARAKTPPMDLLRPSLVNSLTNWMVKAMPTNVEVRRQTPRDLGPVLSSCWRVFLQWILPLSIRRRTCPAMMGTDKPLHMDLEGDHSLNGSSASGVGALFSEEVSSSRIDMDG